MYDQLAGSDSPYLHQTGVPYHSVEELIVEAPDYGHETTSEALSYQMWLEAAYGQVTGDWSGYNQAWDTAETYAIPDLNPTNPKDAESGPPATLEVYTDGNVNWDEVKVPKGLKIIDQRLEAHDLVAPRLGQGSLQRVAGRAVVPEQALAEPAIRQPLEAHLQGPALRSDEHLQSLGLPPGLVQRPGEQAPSVLPEGCLFHSAPGLFQDRP